MYICIYDIFNRLCMYIYIYIYIYILMSEMWESIRQKKTVKSEIFRCIYLSLLYSIS